MQVLGLVVRHLLDWCRKCQCVELELQGEVTVVQRLNRQAQGSSIWLRCSIVEEERSKIVAYCQSVFTFCVSSPFKISGRFRKFG